MMKAVNKVSLARSLGGRVGAALLRRRGLELEAGVPERPARERV